MLWTSFSVLCLLVGLAAMGHALLADLAHGWDGMQTGLRWLVFVLPLVSLLGLVLLGGIAAKTGLRWASVAALAILLGATQFAALLIWDIGRATMSFMPVVLIAVSCLALRPAVVVPFSASLQRASPIVALLGLLVIAVAFAMQIHRRTQAERSQQAYAAQEAQRDATLRGLERAAWLLSREFANCSEADFIRTQSYRPADTAIQYRWAPEKQRLILTVPLFTEPWRRDQILPFAAQALQTTALRTGVRPDLDGGTLDCRTPLECTVTWAFDVEPMHPRSGALQPSLKGIEVRAWQEISQLGK